MNGSVYKKQHCNLVTIFNIREAGLHAALKEHLNSESALCILLLISLFYVLDFANVLNVIWLGMTIKEHRLSLGWTFLTSILRSTFIFDSLASPNLLYILCKHPVPRHVVVCLMKYAERGKVKTVDGHEASLTSLQIPSHTCNCIYLFINSNRRS